MGIFSFFKKKTNPLNNKLKQAICELEKNEVRLTYYESSIKYPLNISKFGGCPYLPNSFKWPTFTSYEDGINRPLSFICQVNLEQFSLFDKDSVLPNKGMLYLFYECESLFWGLDPKDKGALRVYYYENTEGFELLSAPSDLKKEYVVPELIMSFNNKKSYPLFEEFEFYNNLEADWDEYDSILNYLGINLDEEDISKMLGYANIIQGEMLSECERVSRGLSCSSQDGYENLSYEINNDIDKKASEWLLLFQIGTISNNDFELMFGDCGYIYVYIRKSDLLEKRFDKIQFSLQCY